LNIVKILHKKPGLSYRYDQSNFVETDSEYIANVPLKEKQLVTHLIYSNSNQILEQQIFIFEVLCEKPIAALWHATFGIIITKHFVVFCVVSCVVFFK
jgi:hypothetical protein